MCGSEEGGGGCASSGLEGCGAVICGLPGMAVIEGAPGNCPEVAVVDDALVTAIGRLCAGKFD